MNALVPMQAGAIPAAFASFANMPDMNKAAQAGIQASFAAVGFKGKNWRVKYRGDENLVLDDRGNPAPNLDVVIVGIASAISKQFYDKKYTEGDDSAPDCFSIDGMAPDAASPKKQCDTCAVCPKNVWGSRITDNGAKAKACQDSRRLAVVPLGDILNEDYGGPMLLRLPPTSLKSLDAYSRELGRFGAQPFMVSTALGFDTSMAYPLITFKAMGWIQDAEQADQIKTLIDDEDNSIKRMLNEEVEGATHDTAQPESSALASGAPAAALAAPAVALAVPVPAAEPVPVAAAPAPVAAAKPPKASPFSQGAKAATPAQAAPAPVQAATPEPASLAAVQAEAQVQEAPEDLAKAIDDLLAG